MYAESPRIVNVTAHSLGAATRATHAVGVREEMLGRSNGDPGQIYHLRNTPVLDLRPGETVEVEDKREGEVVFVPWELVPDFADSDRYDRHFTLDPASGEVSFGPAVRQPDGTVRQYGRVPEAGRSIRFSQYRHGGGGAGNVPAGKIQVLKSAIPYIDRVINLRRAEGGRDQESLDEAKMRAARELRAQQRAVTAEDYENLAKKASRAVARVKCRAPGQGDKTLPPGMLELLIVPAAFDALQVGDVSKLQIDQALRQTVVNYLDRYRLLTTTLRVREPTYLGVQVCAQIVPGEYSQPDAVRARVIDSLKAFITPLALDRSEEADWEGWPFGRDLYVAEIYSLIQKVPGVKHVLEVRLNQREVLPSKEASSRREEDRPEAAAEGALIPVVERRLEVPDDTLLCSLDHQVEIVDL